MCGPSGQAPSRIPFDHEFEMPPRGPSWEHEDGAFPHKLLQEVVAWGHGSSILRNPGQVGPNPSYEGHRPVEGRGPVLRGFSSTPFQPQRLGSWGYSSILKFSGLVSIPHPRAKACEPSCTSKATDWQRGSHPVRRPFAAVGQMPRGPLPCYLSI
jgi:hypothetical protein